MAITHEQFRKNITTLKQSIPIKPRKYTSEYPKTLEECLTLYCNQKTTHLLQINTILLHENNWPLPLWYNPNKFKIGFFNKLYILISPLLRKGYRKEKGFGYPSYLTSIKIFYKVKIDEIVLEAFDANKNYTFKKLENHILLKSKLPILQSIKKSYLDKNYTACITTILPLIDFISRKFLQSTNLTHDVKKIAKLFEENGITLENSEDLMPLMNSVLKSKNDPNNDLDYLENLEKMKDFDLGIIGCALSSFIKFANTYYSFYKFDSQEESTELLNRHAILHGSSTIFGTKENAIKLITFLILLLELEKVFEILLKPYDGKKKEKIK